jgi:hypothetical protein
MLALGTALTVVGPRLIGAAAGPEVEIITALKLLERKGIDFPIEGGELRLGTLNFQRISVVVDPNARRATVTCTLDLIGRFVRGGGSEQTRISSLGLERMEFSKDASGWAPNAPVLPRLAGIIERLEQRRIDVSAKGESADPAWAELALIRDAAARRLTSEVWLIRSEREHVLVSEDYRLRAETRDRPVDRKGTRQMVLVEAQNRFRFENDPL